MKKLVQNEACSIIYDENGEELFRCPRALDGQDLVRYLNECRDFVGFESDDDTEDLYDVEGMITVDYYRLYFRSGLWSGSWMNLYRKEKLEDIECHGVDSIVKWFAKTFTNGCDYYMKDYFAGRFPTWGVHKEVYLLRPIGSKYYKVSVDTKYGNGDYPVRIYVYRDKE